MAIILKLNDINEQEVGDPRHRVRARTWNRSNLTLPRNATHFGFSTQGQLIVEAPHTNVKLNDGGFFRVQGEATVSGGRGFALSVPGARGFTQISGPFSDVPWVDYLPGGKQNCLIWPAAVSYPTLNTLKMEPRQSQENHAHDSIRINVIISGSGYCVVEGTIHEIETGDVVIIPANESHLFQTRLQGLSFIAFHPDSDTSVFSEYRNPMILKTYGLVRKS